MLKSNLTSQTNSRLEFQTVIPPALRNVLIVVGFLPLIAPYQLIVKPFLNESWSFSLVSLIFLIFFTFISIGTILVGFVFVLAGLFGMDQHTVIDKDRKCITYKVKFKKDS